MTALAVDGGPDERQAVEAAGAPLIYEEFIFSNPGDTADDGATPAIVLSVTDLAHLSSEQLEGFSKGTVRSASGAEWFDLSPGGGWSSVGRVLANGVVLQVNGTGVTTEDLVAVGDSIEVEL